MEGFTFTEKVERWGVFEAAVKGFADGILFEDYEITGTFVSKDETKTVTGFYDGCVYKVRFMPGFAQPYHFEISGSFSDEIYTETLMLILQEKTMMARARVAPRAGWLTRTILY